MYINVNSTVWCRKVFLIFAAIAYFLLLPIRLAASETLHKESMLMARCEFVYAYTAQLMQLKNNIGAAQNIARRSAFITTANMMLNEEQGVIAGWKIERFNSVRAPLKQKLDSGEVKAINLATECDKSAIPVANSVRLKGKKLWGKDFDEIHDAMTTKFKQSIGLN